MSVRRGERLDMAPRGSEAGALRIAIVEQDREVLSGERGQLFLA